MLDGLRRSVIIADPKLTCGRFPEQCTKMSTVRITKMGYCNQSVGQERRPLDLLAVSMLWASSGSGATEQAMQQVSFFRRQAQRGVPGQQVVKVAPFL